jgi:small subunit ribosomal protein S4
MYQNALNDPDSRARRPTYATKAFDIPGLVAITTRSATQVGDHGQHMTKRVQAKSKICRRLGVNLWGRAKNPIVKHDYPPGEHGTKRRKTSDFGTQLAAKQKLKGYYGNITERQFHRLYQEAARRRGDTAENMIGLLERRLDMVIYRLNFVPTIFAARQFANHGHVMVNGRRVTIPSYLVREGDTIEVREKSKNLALVLESIQQPERDVPDYLSVDFKNLKGTYVRVPKLADVPYPVQMEPKLVIEYYSR